MPDWSYLPLLRPMLRLRGRRGARSSALGSMRAIAALPFGARFIEAFGDLSPAPELADTIAGILFPSSVGIGGGLDVDVRTTIALARLGAGFVEIGPITRDAIGSGPSDRDADDSLVYVSPLENPGARIAVSRLDAAKETPTPLAIRLAHAPGAGIDEATREMLELATTFAPYATFFTLDLRAAFESGWTPSEIEALVRAVCSYATTASERRPVIVCIPPDVDTESASSVALQAIDAGAIGVSICGGEGVVTAANGNARRTGPTTHRRSVDLVRAVRERLGRTPVIIGSGGILSPLDALAFVDAGATLVQVHTGLADAGPGLIKRIGSALVARSQSDASTLAPVSARFRWTWLTLLGIGLAVVSTLAGVVALTSVILPYDETYLGMSRAGIVSLDDRLLPFMVHDRVTLAGTLLALGILYGALAAFAVRHGERWAWRIVTLSAMIGFASYWLWLRFGYSDPLHAIATGISIMFYIVATFALMPVRTRGWVDRNDRAWRRSLLGQLLFVTCGIGFMIGGATISAVGITSIFVQTDLIYLHTTPDAIAAANKHLAPLIAHDRAGFGGCLLADGLAFALTAMWGMRRGARWLWWTILASGIPGFGATLAVHFGVGYTTFWHLAPVYFALVLYVAGLALSREYFFSEPLRVTAVERPEETCRHRAHREKADAEYERILRVAQIERANAHDEN